MFEIGKRFAQDELGNISIFRDTRTQLAGEIPCAWNLSSASSRKQNRQLCDLHVFASSQLHMLAFHAIRDISDRFWIPPSRAATNAIQATGHLSRLLGPESVAAAESLFMLLYEYKERKSPLTSIPEELLMSILEIAVTKDNFYFKVKLIDAWINNLAFQEKWVMVRSLLVKGLELFRSCSADAQSNWIYALDPILDILEFHIVLFESWDPDQAQAARYKKEYKEYCQQYYPSSRARRCLGCGVGIFGTSFARLRIGLDMVRLQIPSTAQREPNPDEQLVFDILETVFGRSGSSAPDVTEDTPRYIEQEWSVFRFNVYLSVLGAKILDTSSATFGRMGYGGWTPKIGIPPDILKAEELRIRGCMRAIMSMSDEEDHGPTRSQLVGTTHTEAGESTENAASKPNTNTPQGEKVSRQRRHRFSIRGKLEKLAIRARIKQDRSSK
jgi:hypothetical protein